MFKKTGVSCLNTHFEGSLSKSIKNDSWEHTLYSGRKCCMKTMLALSIVLIFSFSHSRIWASDGIRNSVVKILTTQRMPDMFKPWTKQSPRDVFATGVVIEGNRILTNAHAVAFAGQIYIQPYQSAEKIYAKVVAEAPGIDLAVLEIDNESFFKDHPPLPFDRRLPKAKDTVNVYGYPVGGKELSVTEGIVSRIDFSRMNYSVLSLRIQIDAALNPGNSGGPAVAENKIIGLVSSKIKKAESVGYLIPVEEIKMFLDDISDGTYEGKPALHSIEISLQTVENDALRKRLGVKKDTNGIMVSRVQNRIKDFPLKPWDIITHLGDHSVDSEGHVRVHDDLRLPMHYLVPGLVKDGKINMIIFREGKSQKIQVPVRSEAQSLIRFCGNKYPRYFIYGPLVFSPVTSLFLKGMNARLYQYLMSVGSPIITRRIDLAAFDGEEMVAIASPMFPHRITKGYDTRNLLVVSHINDVKIKNLTHLVETLRDIKDEYLIFRFSDLASETLVFNRKEIEASTEDILSDNGIRHQCSKDLRSVWER